MSSSIEEQFDPPEWATREEVIKAARHYINYWKIEARQRNAQWLEAIKPRPPAWQPIETAPKDGTDVLLYREYSTDVGSYSYQEGRNTVWACGSFMLHGPTHWMPLPTPPADDSRS